MQRNGMPKAVALMALLAAIAASFPAVFADPGSLPADFLDPSVLIQWGGVIGIAAMIFVETGLFFGFFLPGDSLLITAGILAAAGHLDFRWLVSLSVTAAIAGDQTNYTIGRHVGRHLNQRYSRFRIYLKGAEDFYGRHGPKTVTIARFVPVIRTFAPAVAGAAKMDYMRFVTYNVMGGILWVASTTAMGYVLGSVVPQIDRYLSLVIAVVIGVSFLPPAIGWLKTRKKRRR